MYHSCVIEMLKINGMEPSAALHSRTVRQVVKDMMDFLSYPNAHEATNLYVEATQKVVDVLTSCERVLAERPALTGLPAHEESAKDTEIRDPMVVTTSTSSVDTMHSNPKNSDTLGTFTLISSSSDTGAIGGIGGSVTGTLLTTLSVSAATGGPVDYEMVGSSVSDALSCLHMCLFYLK